MSDIDDLTATEETEALRGKNTTHNRQLRDLIEEWREKQEQLTLPESGITGEGVAFKRCADELEELIE